MIYQNDRQVDFAYAILTDRRIRHITHDVNCGCALRTSTNVVPGFMPGFQGRDKPASLRARINLAPTELYFVDAQIIYAG